MILQKSGGALIALALWLSGVETSVPAGQGPREKSPPSLEDLDRLVAVERARAGVDTIEPIASALLRQKRHHCMRAIGDVVLCGCLSDTLRIGTSFAEYVRVVSTSKDALGYGYMSVSERQGIDTIFSARELCVGRAYTESRK